MNGVALVRFILAGLTVGISRVDAGYEWSEEKLIKPLFSSEEEAADEWLPLSRGKKMNTHQIEGRSLKKKVLKAPESFHCTFQGKLAIPNECSKHYVCERPGMRSVFGYCTEPKQFHHQKRTCLTISQKECRASMCKDSGDRFPDPYTKENYLTCYRMFPEVMVCSDGKIYNKKLKTCVEGSVTDGLKGSGEADSSSEMNNNEKNDGAKDSNSTANPENQLSEDDKWTDRADDHGSKHADDHHASEAGNNSPDPDSSHDKSPSGHHKDTAQGGASKNNTSLHSNPESLNVMIVSSTVKPKV